MATSSFLSSPKKCFLWGLLLLGISTIFYYVFKDYKWAEVYKSFKEAKLQWIVFASIAHLINHLLRAYRWRFLLKTQKEEVPLEKAYLAEMTGFCINVFPLRAGEFFRCKSLKEMHGTPIHRSLGTVIMERGVDMLVLGIGFVLALAFYFTDVKGLWYMVLAAAKKEKPSVWEEYLYPQSPGHALLLLGGSMLLLAVIGYVVLKMKDRIVHFLHELWPSLKATRKVSSLSFWGITVLILIFYVLLEYLTFFALKETSTLTNSFFPVLCVFICLNLSHLLPLGNGLGIYHVVIPLCLKPFGVPEEKGLAYAIITHGIQTFNALVIGGICMLFSFRYMRSKKKLTSSRAKQQGSQPGRVSLEG